MDSTPSTGRGCAGKEDACAGLAGRRILLVDPAPAPPKALCALPDTASLFHAALPALTAELLLRTRPDVVVTPLVTERHDILDVAQRLIRLGYAGPLIALSAPLPRLEMVLREVHAVWAPRPFEILQDEARQCPGAS